MKRYCFVLCLSVLGLHPAVQAQEAMYVHTQGRSLALDLNNIEYVAVSNDTVSVGTDAIYQKADVDSITFVQPQGDVWLTGWWGDLPNGLSACYYEQDLPDLPSLELQSADGICQTAYCNIAHQPAQARGPRRVGGKWRYVRGTLSGQHKLQYHFLDELPYGGYSDCGGPDADHVAIDLCPLLGQRPVAEVRRVVNYWYQPDIKSQMPAAPVFGEVGAEPDGSLYHYVLYLHEDSVFIHINTLHDWQNDSSVIIGDSMFIGFKSEEVAKAEYEQLVAAADSSLSVVLQGAGISVIETFEPTDAEEVGRWLVRFDLDMNRPVFIREEE